MPTDNIAESLAVVIARAEGVAQRTAVGSDINEVAFAVRDLIACVAELNGRLRSREDWRAKCADDITWQTQDLPK